MTKEELEKEAEEYANNLAFVFETDIVQRIVRERVRLALIDVLEPREKQIQIDAEQIRALQKQNGELTDKVTELEAQIEKMKCCYNCSKWYDGECEESPKSKTFFCADFKCDNWEIADD